MLIGGAYRHAKEILDIIYNQNQNNLDNIVFFDDVSDRLSKPASFYSFKILHSLDEAREQFKSNAKFVLGLGGTINRSKMYEKLKACGGEIHSIVASTAVIGHYNVLLEDGLNIMNFSFISSEVNIGKGTLINAYAAIHHDVTIGKFCEISPRATILGGCKIGDFSSIGSGATILPDIVVGQNVIIGAGTIVTKDVPDNSLVMGVPGKLVKKL